MRGKYALGRFKMTSAPPNTRTQTPPPGANTAGNSTPNVTEAEFEQLFQRRAISNPDKWQAVHEVFIKQQTGQAQAQREADAPRFTPIEAVDLLSPRPPKDYLLDGVYIAGKLYAIAGEPGCGKSFYALGLAMHVANGAPFLGRTTKQSPVLYVDEENGVEEYKDRAPLIAKGAGFDLSKTPITGLMDEGINISKADDLDELEQFILDRGIRFTVIDSLVATIGGLDENSASDMEPPLRELGQLARRTNCTILLIHHVKKPTKGSKDVDYRGSSAIKGKVDGLQTMVEAGGANSSRVRFDKNRQGKRFEYAYETEFIEDLNTGEVSEVKFISKALVDVKSQQKPPAGKVMIVLEFLDSNSNGAATYSDISNMLESNGVPKGSVSNTITRIGRDGYIMKIKESPSTWQLTKDGAELIKRFGDNDVT